ncbi:D-2-hydroxyacid dehydrogenase family protein [Vibrio sp.]|uniref:D-2-hydroxyacid dehydrogenase family protein n=1 Tax=Vibrio sp. TaxID=678 RepID=UPI003D0F4742
MKIAILDDYQDAVRHLNCFKLLKDHQVTVLTQSYQDPEELATQLTDVEALVLIRERTVISEELLQKLPSLKLISQTGKVSQHLDPLLCARYGVAVAEGVGSPIAPAELCWALIMAASRNLPGYVEQLQRGNWQNSGSLGLGRTLHGLTLGIWGFGKIGQRVAEFARAFGMQVLVWGSVASRQRAAQLGYGVATNKEGFFSQADIVSLHLRLVPETLGCVTSDDLAMMKPDSLFVNISRADLVEPGALAAEMQAQPTKRAAVDVYVNEPASKQDEPLLTLSNVLCTPHLGYVEHNSYELYFRAAFENVLSYAAGKTDNVVTV